MSETPRKPSGCVDCGSASILMVNEPSGVDRCLFCALGNRDATISTLTARLAEVEGERDEARIKAGRLDAFASQVAEALCLEHDEDGDPFDLVDAARDTRHSDLGGSMMLDEFATALGIPEGVEDRDVRALQAASSLATERDSLRAEVERVKAKVKQQSVITIREVGKVRGQLDESRAEVSRLRGAVEAIRGMECFSRAYSGLTIREMESVRDQLTAALAPEGEGEKGTPSGKCFFPQCNCVSPSLGDCEGKEHVSPTPEKASET